ncbi:hypothetical protein CFPU101_37360 [Chroococcus sp. FPU101]|nr:hypothetical protein CFPU101_37360 [Chroococcus sp. FPU101]
MQWILMSQKTTSYRPVWLWLVRLILIIAVCIQLSSVALSSNLEIVQQELGVGSHFRLMQRLKNISLLLIHDTDDSEMTKLKIPAQKLDESEQVWTFLPFKLTQKVKSEPFLAQYLLITFILWGLVLILAIRASILLMRSVM